MGLISVTTMQGVCDPSLFIFPGLGYAHYRWHGKILFASSILNQIASYLAHSVAKRRTIAVPHIEFTADQYTYIIRMVPCSTLWNEEGAHSLAEP